MEVVSRLLGRSGTRALRTARPLFVIGCGRSGTTFLAKLLNAHPAVLMTNEAAVFFQLHRLIQNNRDGVQRGEIYGKEHHSLWGDLLARHARGLIETFYADLAVALKKPDLRYWGEKHPSNVECLEWIASLYPQARYIYLVRDPRDTAVSMARMLSSSFASAFEVWQDLANAHEQFAASLDSKRLWLLRYEDLVFHPEAYATSMFEWLGLPFTQDVRAFLQVNKRRDVHEPDAPEKDFRSKSVGGWRALLSPADLVLVRELATDYMRKYEDAR